MSKKFGKVLASAFSAAVFVIVVHGCNETQSAAPAQPAVAPAPVAPVAAPAPVVATPAPVAAPVAPPATPLMPIGEPTTGGTDSTLKKGGGGGSIDAPLPGQKTSGEELAGNYQCNLDAKQLQIGPFKAPPFGCKINKSGDGSMKVSSTAEGAGSLKGSVQDSTPAGFFIVGTYTVAGNKLDIKARMKLKGVGKYVGSGRGKFNDDKSNQMKYTLTMTKQ